MKRQRREVWRKSGRGGGISVTGARQTVSLEGRELPMVLVAAEVVARVKERDGGGFSCRA
jgi:hypothetical protein